MTSLFVILHCLFAAAALVAAARFSLPSGSPAARPQLCAALFALGMTELYAMAASAGLTVLWPWLDLLGLPWPLLLAGLAVQPLRRALRRRHPVPLTGTLATAR